MRQPKVSTDTIIDLLASGHTVGQISEMKGSKRNTLQRQIERLRLKYNCKNITELVVKLKLSVINTTIVQPK